MDMGMYARTRPAMANTRSARAMLWRVGLQACNNEQSSAGAALTRCSRLISENYCDLDGAG